MTVKKMKVGPGVLKLNAVRDVTITTTLSETTITAATNTFLSSDVGASITGANIAPGTTISSVTSPTEAELSAAATAAGADTATITPAGGVQDFSCQITNAVVSWSDESEDAIPVLCGDEEDGDTDWSATLGGSMVQDPEVLVPWTWANKGKKVTSVFVPSNAAAKQVVGVLTVKPLNFGGEVKTTATSDFEWPYKGEPVLEDVPVEV